MVLFVFQISQNEIWKFGRNLPLAKFVSERVKGAKVHRADLESGSSHIGLVFIPYRIAFRVGRDRNEPTTMKTAAQVTKFAHASLRKVMRSQVRICTTWPSFPFTCRLLFIISSPKLVISCNFLSIRIVLTCFYLLIFYFEKFSTWIGRLLFEMRCNKCCYNKALTVY